MTEPLDPAQIALLRRCLTEREFERFEHIGLGYSGALVLALPAAEPGMQPSFVKIDHVNSANSLLREHAVLRHLADVLPVPRVLAFDEVDDHWVLRMSAVPGIDASDARLHAHPERLVAALAQALRQIHALPVDAHGCFDRRLDATLAEAERRLRAGQVDLDDLDDERQGMTAEALAQLLHTNRPADEDLVPTHGDYCLPNVLFNPHSLALTGFVDLGRFGLADRHQDLALAVRSLRHNLECDYADVFFEAYGVTPNRDKLAFYQLLDEFF